MKETYAIPRRLENNRVWLKNSNDLEIMYCEISKILENVRSYGSIVSDFS